MNKCNEEREVDIKWIDRRTERFRQNSFCTCHCMWMRLMLICPLLSSRTTLLLQSSNIGVKVAETSIPIMVMAWIIRPLGGLGNDRCPS